MKLIFPLGWDCHHPSWLSYFTEGFKAPTRHILYKPFETWWFNMIESFKGVIRCEIRDIIHGNLRWTCPGWCVAIWWLYKRTYHCGVWSQCIQLICLGNNHPDWFSYVDGVFLAVSGRWSIRNVESPRIFEWNAHGTFQNCIVPYCSSKVIRSSLFHEIRMGWEEHFSNHCLLSVLIQQKSNLEVPLINNTMHLHIHI